MSQRTLSCGVPPDLYDRFKQSIPDGQNVNGWMRKLIEDHLDRIDQPKQVIPEGCYPTAGQEAGIASRIVASLVAVPNLPNGAEYVESLDTSGCTHPRGMLHREGPYVRCECGSLVNRSA